MIVIEKEPGYTVVTDTAIDDIAALYAITGALTEDLEKVSDGVYANEDSLLNLDQVCPAYLTSSGKSLWTAIVLPLKLPEGYTIDPEDIVAQNLTNLDFRNYTAGSSTSLLGENIADLRIEQENVLVLHFTFETGINSGNNSTGTVYVKGKLPISEIENTESESEGE